MQQPVESFPLSRKQQGKLKAAGFETAEDLKDTSVAELSKELSIPPSEALEILHILLGVPIASDSHTGGSNSNHVDPLPDVCPAQSALELLRTEQAQPFVVTFSAKVDEMLGGGVSMGKITELCGAPGVGKTQFSMQLAVDVCIPEPFGGVDGEAIYIDTEGSFVVERVAEVATAAVQHIASVAEKSEDSELLELAKSFTLDRVLGGIHYFRCHDYVELTALVNILPQFVSEHPQVKLVVVDSVAAPFRHGFDDMGMRNRVLSGMAQNLIQLATLRNIAIVLTNQMTTRPNPHGRGPSQLVPALGESWGHVCTVRVVLYWNQAQRFATLYKSPTQPEAVVPFQVTQDGVRDMFEDADIPPSQVSEGIQEWQSLSSTQLEQLESWAEEEEGEGGEDQVSEQEAVKEVGTVEWERGNPAQFVSSTRKSTRKRARPEP